jgi:hypothetical protein
MGRRSLSEGEQADLVAFLRALTSEAFVDSAAVARTWEKFRRR